MAGELFIANLSGLTAYAQIKNSVSRRWNGSQFEPYSAGNYSLYNVSMTEQGGSGTYSGDFPSGIITAGHYEIIYYSQDGGSPAEGDRVIGVGSLDWAGDEVAASSDVIPGAMSGDDWYQYVLRALKRTDKETEVFDATKDTITDMRDRLIFPENETDGDIVDTISVLGEYRMDLPGDFGHFLSAVVLIDGDFGFTLWKISKDEFDRKYTGFGTGASSRGRPKEFTVYGGKILVGPVPDKTSYTYKQAYSSDDRASYTADSVSIPFTDKYREMMRWGVLQRLFADILKNDDQAAKFGTLYESKLRIIERQLDRNKKGRSETKYQGV